MGFFIANVCRKKILSRDAFLTFDKREVLIWTHLCYIKSKKIYTEYEKIYTCSSGRGCHVLIY